jgi:hypothetical protein
MVALFLRVKYYTWKTYFKFNEGLEDLTLAYKADDIFLMRGLKFPSTLKNVFLRFGIGNIAKFSLTDFPFDKNLKLLDVGQLPFKFNALHIPSSIKIANLNAASFINLQLADSLESVIIHINENRPVDLQSILTFPSNLKHITIYSDVRIQINSNKLPSKLETFSADNITLELTTLPPTLRELRVFATSLDGFTFTFPEPMRKFTFLSRNMYLRSLVILCVITMHRDCVIKNGSRIYTVTQSTPLDNGMVIVRGVSSNMDEM